MWGGYCIKIDEGLRTLVGISILVGIITFAVTSGFWMFVITNDSGYSDVMTRSAIESLDMANDCALQGDWSNASKFLEVSVSFLWRASWENDIASRGAWNQHIMD